MRNTQRFLASIPLIVLTAGTGMAAVRTFVSALNGSDANLCTRTAPCRTFITAMVQTDSGGEIVVLDSGGYSPFTINKTVTLIAADSVHAAVSPTSAAAILINAPGELVKIRGLVLNGLGGEDGIDVDFVGSLHLEDVSVEGFTDNGIQFITSAHLFIKDSAFRHNNIGVRMNTGPSTAAIDNVVFEQNTLTGMNLGANGEAVVRNSFSVRNQTGYGCSGGSQLTLENSVVAHGVDPSSTGVSGGSGCIVRVSNCTLVNLTNGLQNVADTATILSAGNNTIEDVTTAFLGTVGTYTRR